jgi:hypothetical protein
MKLRRVPLIVVTLSAALSGCAGGPDQAEPPGTAASTTTSTTTPPTSTSSSPGLVADNQSPTSARTGPARAEVGVAYPFDLLAHCGVNYAVFAGRTWKVEQPVADPPGEPLARGSVNYLPGSMRLVAADELRFTVDGGSRVIPGVVVVFRPTAEERPLCQ